jgi:hypothetical protein
MTCLFGNEQERTRIMGIWLPTLVMLAGYYLPVSISAFFLRLQKAIQINCPDKLENENPLFSLTVAGFYNVRILTHTTQEPASGMSMERSTLISSRPTVPSIRDIATPKLLAHWLSRPKSSRLRPVPSTMTPSVSMPSLSPPTLAMTVSSP